jgi:hypothetical protein
MGSADVSPDAFQTGPRLSQEVLGRPYHRVKEARLTASFDGRDGPQLVAAGLNS